jgi:hypothetical protein
MPPTYDLVVKNARVVRPNRTAVERQDIGILDGRFACLAPEIRAEEGKALVDGRNRLAFPGVVDAHMHIGIYQPLAADAVTESKAAARQGHQQSQLPAHGPVLPEPRRPVRRVHAGGDAPGRRQLLGRLRLPHRAHRRVAHRGDGLIAHPVGRAVVQDLHVLRRLRAARKVIVAKRVPDDRPRRSL